MSVGGGVLPLGGLSIASFLQKAGADIRWFDSTYRWDRSLLKYQGVKRPPAAHHGIGRMYRETAPKPEILKTVPLTWKVFGMPYALIEEELRKESLPDLICVTSGLVYQYRGVHRIIEIARRVFPGVPILLGGIYSTLCTEHAKRCSGADEILPGEAEAKILPFLAEKFSVNLSSIPCDSLDVLPAPDWNLYLQRGDRLDAIAIMTSRGCPYRCHYCASFQLQTYRRRDISGMVEEIRGALKVGARHVVFYDDALLVGAEHHFDPLMRAISAARLPVFFHTPNSMHCRMITPERARLMRAANFRSLRISLETIDSIRQREGGKVTTPEAVRAARCLLDAGFPPRDIGIYYMIAQPGQTMIDMVDTLALASSLGVTAIPLPYSLIPGTQDFTKAQAAGQVPDPYDPLYAHKELYLYRDPATSRDDMKRILRLARINRNFVRYNMNLWGGDEITKRFRFDLAGGMDAAFQGLAPRLAPATPLPFRPEDLALAREARLATFAGETTGGKGLDPCGRISLRDAPEPLRAEVAA